MADDHPPREAPRRGAGALGAHARVDEYMYTAGGATTRFLQGIAEGKILGERAPGGKVYVPSRGADPELGKPTSEQVELPNTGTLTSFCVVNVAFYGQGMEIPYTAGLILLDGADLPMMCLLQEVDVKDVRIGMRVEAVWVDDAELGAEPREHQVVPADRRARRRGRPAGQGGDVVRDVAVIAFAQMPNVRRETVLNEVEMLMPVIEDVRAKAGLTSRTSASPAPAPPTTWPARRSASCRPSTASARGRPSRRATSRWTAPGRSTRPG